MAYRKGCASHVQLAASVSQKKDEGNEAVGTEQGVEAEAAQRLN
jgi:hypothetical protein